MRFSAPRSVSPSPTRTPRHNNKRPVQKQRIGSAFRLGSDDDSADAYDTDEESSESDSGSEPVNSSSEDEELEDKRFGNGFNDSNRSSKTKRTLAEQRQYEDTVAAIRFRTRHYDPYEDWEKQTRRDAFRTAQKELSVLQTEINSTTLDSHTQSLEQLSHFHARQLSEAKLSVDNMNRFVASEQHKLLTALKTRDQRLWQRIDAVIKIEEMKKQEEARRAMEEEERRAEEAERKRKQAEEKRIEEEAERKQLERTEQERRQQEEALRLRKEQEQAGEQERQALGMSTAEADWTCARNCLLELKAGPMKIVKANKELKSTWSALRRQITPKIGQLTSDSTVISKISRQLQDLLRPPTLHPPEIYLSLLSALSKSILLQAETEVTAEKRAAEPLAAVTTHLLNALPSFAEIFFAKLVQRAGRWPVPIEISLAGIEEKEHAKVLGYRVNGDGTMESKSEHASRIGGMMRLYFCIVSGKGSRILVQQQQAGFVLLPPQQQQQQEQGPLPKMFQVPRYWTWFARLMSERSLLQSEVAPIVIYAALDVFGLEARSVWGYQWTKLLGLLHEGVTVGFAKDKYIGGSSPEGKAARVRVQLCIERIFNGGI